MLASAQEVASALRMDSELQTTVAKHGIEAAIEDLNVDVSEAEVRDAVQATVQNNLTDHTEGENEGPVVNELKYTFTCFCTCKCTLTCG